MALYSSLNIINLYLFMVNYIFLLQLQVLLGLLLFNSPSMVPIIFYHFAIIILSIHLNQESPLMLK